MNYYWEEVTIISKKELDSEHVYNEKYLRNKIKFYKKKSTQIFTIIKYQKEALTVFLCH